MEKKKLKKIRINFPKLKKYHKVIFHLTNI